MRKLITAALMAAVLSIPLMAASPADAAPGRGHDRGLHMGQVRHAPQDGRGIIRRANNPVIRGDLWELRHDRRELRGDRREFRRDRRELGWDIRRGEPRPVIRGDIRELRHDRRELRGDRRELHHDRRELRRDLWSQ